MSAPLPSISFVITSAAFSDLNIFVTVQPTVIYTGGPAPLPTAPAVSMPSATPNSGVANPQAPSPQSVSVPVANDGPLSIRRVASAIQRAFRIARRRLRTASRDS
ncbi:hypothetical protein C8F04DRAFT_1240988 [Mycena alexandri]|uniref:Uncharacterized protein n=1 Tax=Mycena alexandri TaxID=1745969 RepID=A0AAD6WR52_9AGAR|nr:hypothetical protein C8F04DRAFT_1240988 [Mycena alexandri]